MPQSDSAPEAVHRKTVPVDFPVYESLFLDPAPPRKKPAPQIRVDAIFIFLFPFIVNHFQTRKSELSPPQC